MKRVVKSVLWSKISAYFWVVLVFTGPLVSVLRVGELKRYVKRLAWGPWGAAGVVELCAAAY